MVNRRPTYKVSEGARTTDKLKALLRKLSNPLTRKSSSTQSKFEYAILPDDEKLEGWTREEMEEMDDMVRHMLHSKRAKFKRSMKGFKQYVRRRKYFSSPTCYSSNHRTLQLLDSLSLFMQL